MTPPLSFRPFDADEHYYEALDAFTRHVDRRMQKRAIQWVEIDGRKRILVAGKLDRFIPNPTFDPITRPGALEDYFRGKNPGGKTQAELFIGQIEKLRPEYRDRDARIALLDQQGMEGALLFPTLGCGVEEPLRHDAEACHAALHGFNQWLHEDWGFAYQGRLFAVPMMTLMDPALAVRDLEWAISRGARVVYMRPAPVPKPTGSTSPGHTDHDPFWARCAEAGVTVAFHAADSGYGRYAAAWEGARQMEGFRGHAFGMSALPGRAVMDTFAALLVHGVFRRFPKLQVASIENGSFWVPWLFTNLKKAFGQMPDAFGHEDPREVFRRHVSVAPYFEDDIPALVDLIGAERVLYGSDFPHAEGLREPLDFAKELDGLSAADVRAIMRENPRRLVQTAA
ncbi:MAG TPA: amidohydrolase family protein [Myxococcota bacterium]|nr:amidohydrolase family protein [Myxococcota bacterium]